MNWTKLAKKVAGLGFPMIGGMLAGPNGKQAGEWIAEKFGVDTPDDGDALEAAVANDPEAVIKLQQIQSDRIVSLAQVDLAETQAQLADVQDARKMRVSLALAGAKDYMPQILAIAMLVGFFATAWIVLRTVIAPEMQNLASMVVGFVLAKLGGIIDYFFGSSLGSARKTEIMAQNGQG